MLEVVVTCQTQNVDLPERSLVESAIKGARPLCDFRAEGEGLLTAHVIMTHVEG